MSKYLKARGATGWASYFINGDASAMEPLDLELATAWANKNGWPVSCDDDSHFSWAFGVMTGWNALGVNGGDLLTYDVHQGSCVVCDGAGRRGVEGVCDYCEGSGTNQDPSAPGTLIGY